MFDLPWLWFTVTLVLIGGGFALIFGSAFYMRRYSGRLHETAASEFLERLGYISWGLAVVAAIFAAIALVKTRQTHILILIVLVTVGLGVVIYLIVWVGGGLRRFWNYMADVVREFRRGPGP